MEKAEEEEEEEESWEVSEDSDLNRTEETLLNFNVENHGVTVTIDRPDRTSIISCVSKMFQMFGEKRINCNIIKILPCRITFARPCLCLLSSMTVLFIYNKTCNFHLK